jgi:hypothetical protein
MTRIAAEASWRVAGAPLAERLATVRTAIAAALPDAAGHSCDRRFFTQVS